MEKLFTFLDTKTVASEAPWTFNELIAREFERLHPEVTLSKLDAEKRKEHFETAPAEPADEPWIAFTRHDHFGVALSGGGIRSATFNLGLLQGLDRNEVLQYVHYLSTVSGGGYTGGFWVRWLQTEWERLVKLPPPEKERPENKSLIEKGKVASIFPRQAGKITDTPPDCPSSSKIPGSDSSQKASNLKELRERPEFRHLREFSRFLMPRVGFFQAETWSGIATILAGMIPSLAGTAALVIAGVYAWFSLSYFLLQLPAVAGLLFFAGATCLLQSWFEKRWRQGPKAGDARGEQIPVFVTIMIAITGLAAGGFWAYWRTSIGDVPASLPRWLGYWRHQLDTAAHPHTFQLSTLLFGPALAWSVAALVVIALRFFWSRFADRKRAVIDLAAMDRCAYRCLIPAILWAGAAASWELALWLSSHHLDKSVGAGGPVVFGGLFLWLRNWLLAPIKETQGTRLLQRAAAVLKPLIPQLLAFAAVLSFIIGMTVLVQAIGLHWFSAVLMGGGSLVFLLVILVCFNPALVGMHDFYRARIARCFLGAGRACNATQNRPTFEQRTDDMSLCPPRDPNTGLEKEGRYHGCPIHLVCCAANNLAGDTLSSLYRGCRSAVLSPHGISLGNYTAHLPDVRLSSALTASAAAFNSQMGRVSMRLGPAVAIIMSALNLRLGLWVPHPLNPARHRASLPGLFFFFEMFGFTRSDQSPDSLNERRLQAIDFNSPTTKRFHARLQSSAHLHLSDGAHFENLGLYELIRRHCRYIIVSDCSADPNIDFDDLANALRCIREDFGVEIELDVSTLRPMSPGNRSVQHAVIGTIHYDGLNGTDKGSILYFKPTLTGDEPPDVLQYQARNQAFPHESTGDQFYDEAQWESYRRLGEHAANVVLRFLQTVSHKQTNPVENLFLGASQYWHPAPPRQEESFLLLTERCAQLETQVRDNAPASLRNEFFPEVAGAGFAVSGLAAAEDQTRTIYFIMLAAQTMEDAWLGLQLETYWSHPLNEGWMAYFHRWASTPSFRRWWPILRPLYSAGFADFVKERFNIRIRDRQARNEPPGPGAELELSNDVIGTGAAVNGMAWEHWLARYGSPPREGCGILAYNLRLDSIAGGTMVQKANWLQVGFLLFRKTSDTTVEWTTTHLFVPHALIGAGIMARFLDSLLARFAIEGIKEIRVVLEERPVATDEFARNKGEPQPNERPKHESFPSRKGFRPDPASRYERVHTINFYKSRGFVYLPPEQDGQLRTLSLNMDDYRTKKADSRI